MGSTSLNACGKIVKIAFILVNFFYMLIGIALVGLGSYLIHTGDTFSFFTGSQYFSGAGILIACGIVILIITGVGIAGAFFQHKLVLYIYLIIVVIIIILEVVATILGFVFRNTISDKANEIAVDAVLNKYLPSNFNGSGYDRSVNDAIDNVQETFKCCGWNETSIWEMSEYYRLEMMYPPSCVCTEENPSNETADCIEVNEQFIYGEPCNSGLSDRLRGNLLTLGGIGIGFAIIQLLPVVLVLGLLFAIHKAHSAYVTV